MIERERFFARTAGAVDTGRLEAAWVAVIGAGSVGSMVMFELARCGVGHLLVADGDRLDPENPVRHELSLAYVGCNKAEGMASLLKISVPGIDVGALPHDLDETFSDEELDRFLQPVDLIVIATDDRVAQRRIARRALALDKPAVVPGLYPEGGGEVFVQLNSTQACMGCWDQFRRADAPVRAVSALAADGLAVIQQTIFMCLAMLDERSPHFRDLAPQERDPRPCQLFVIRPGRGLLRTPVTRDEDCESCRVGPSPLAGAPGEEASAATGALRMTASRERSGAAGWPFVLTGAAAPPRFESVTLSAPLVAEGRTVTLSWVAADATHVEIEGHGPQPPVGDLVAPVYAAHAFRLRAVNPYAESVVLSPTVRVMRPPRLSEIPVATLDLHAAPRDGRRAPRPAPDPEQPPGPGFPPDRGGAMPRPPSLSPVFASLRGRAAARPYRSVRPARGVRPAR